MKKLIPLVLIATLGISTASMAKSLPQGGFNDRSPRPELNSGSDNTSLISITTVEQAKQLADRTRVVLQGNITKQIGKEEYIFSDKTGEVQVEIDQKHWHGQTVTPNDLVEIAGKVDKYKNSFEIDVKHVKIMSESK